MSVGLILGENTFHEPEFVNFDRRAKTLFFAGRNISVPYITPENDKPIPTMV